YQAGLDLVRFYAKRGGSSEAANRHNADTLLNDVRAGLLLSRHRQEPALAVIVGLEERNQLLTLLSRTFIVTKQHSGYRHAACKRASARRGRAASGARPAEGEIGPARSGRAAGEQGEVAGYEGRRACGHGPRRRPRAGCHG